MEWGQTRMWSRNTQRDGSTAALVSVLQVHMWRTCAADIRDTQQRLIWDLLRCFCCSVKRNMTLLRTDISSSLTTEDADYRWLSKWPHGHTDSLHAATTLTSDQYVTQYLHLLSCRFTTLEVYSCHTHGGRSWKSLHWDETTCTNIYFNFTLKFQSPSNRWG